MLAGARRRYPDATLAWARAATSHSRRTTTPSTSALAATTASLAALAADPSADHRVAAVWDASNPGRILVNHLAREEDVAFAELVRVVSPEEYDAIESTMLKQTPLRALAFEAPWALTTLGDHARARKLAGVPLPLRLLYRWSFLPRYQRLVERAGM